MCNVNIFLNYNFSQEFQALKSNESKMTKTLQGLNAAKNDKFKRFGAYVPNILKSIDEHCKRGTFHLLSLIHEKLILNPFSHS
jgi:hypothetical protein